MRSPPIRQEMRVGEAVAIFLGSHPEQAQAVTTRFIWLPIVGPLQVPFPNPGRLRHHDLHHVAFGVRATLKGEIVVSVVELRNGPPSFAIGVLCVGAIGLGLLRWPRRTGRLFSALRGWGTIYGAAEPVSVLHGLTVGALRSRLGVPGDGLDDPFWTETG